MTRLLTKEVRSVGEVAASSSGASVTVRIMLHDMSANVDASSGVSRVVSPVTFFFETCTFISSSSRLSDVLLTSDGWRRRSEALLTGRSPNRDLPERVDLRFPELMALKALEYTLILLILDVVRLCFCCLGSGLVLRRGIPSIDKGSVPRSDVVKSR